MRQQTSVASYQNLAPKLQAKQLLAYAAVKAHPKRTARELEKLTGNPDLHKRISELKAKGLCAAGDSRKCSVTGRLALTYVAGGLR